MRHHHRPHGLRHHAHHLHHHHHGLGSGFPLDPVYALLMPYLIAALVGGLLLIALRAFRLRFTWALLGAPPAYLAWLIDPHVGALIGLATAVPLVGGAYQLHEDTQKGGEAARRARETLAPFHVLRRQRALAQARRTARVEHKPKGITRRLSEDRLLLGTNRKGGVRYVPFGRHKGVHGLILGATGSGKTVTQAAIAESYVLAGLPAIVVDPKGDPMLFEVLQQAARGSGRGFLSWSPIGSAIYNPFARGNPTEIADKLLIGQRWSEPHYEQQTRRLLGFVLETMRSAGEWPPTLSGVVDHMDTERLDLLASKVGGSTATRVSSYVDGLSAKEKSTLGGGRDRLAVLAEGEFGPRIDPKLGHGAEIDFERSLHAGDVIYMHLDADRYPAAAKQLGAALVIDLIGLVAKLQRGELQGLVVIDEFAALAAEQVSHLFGRARSAGLSVLLGTQSLADLRASRPEDGGSDTLTEQVLTNVEYVVVHREADPDSAERLARMAGTEPTWVTTQQVGVKVQGLFERQPGTRTPDRDFIVNPDVFKRLAPGEAVLIVPTAKRPGEVIRVVGPKG